MDITGYSTLITGLGGDTADPFFCDVSQQNSEENRAKSLKWLTLVGKYEGSSYLLLLFIAMPMKYFFKMPMAVSIAGSIHGALFVWFMYSLFNAWAGKHLGFGKCVMVFILSLLPFGTFRLERLY